MSAHIFSTHPSLTPNAVRRLAERQRREEQLVHALRRVAFLASQQHSGEPSLSERCWLGRLVDQCDAALRRLLAESARDAR